MVGRIILQRKVVSIKSYANYYCYEWITKFSCYCSKCLYGTFLSEKFTPKSILSTDFRLGMCIGDTNTNGSIYIVFDDEIDSDIYELKFRIGFKNAINLIGCSFEVQNFRNLDTTTSYEYFEDNFEEGPKHCLSFEATKISSIYCNCEYFVKGVLTVVVEIFKPVDVIPVCINSSIVHTKRVLENVQQQKKLSDVTIVAGEREFPAHKAILAAQSSVFLAMFEHDMKEKAENKVIIEDVSGEVMQLILNYMYSGSLGKEILTSDLTSEVLVVADKYALDELVKICEETLIKKLNKDNVFEVMKTANSYKLNSVKKAAVDFIASDIEDIMNRSEFHELACSSIDLLKEIILAVKTKPTFYRI